MANSNPHRHLSKQKLTQKTTCLAKPTSRKDAHTEEAAEVADADTAVAAATAEETDVAAVATAETDVAAIVAVAAVTGQDTRRPIS
jgi:hypothetical protein